MHCIEVQVKCLNMYLKLNIEKLIVSETFQKVVQNYCCSEFQLKNVIKSPTILKKIINAICT